MKTAKTWNTGKGRRAVFLFAAVLLSAFLLAGCGGKDLSNSKYVGKWNADKASVSGMEVSVSSFMDEFSFDLKSDGSCTVKMDDESYTGTWDETDDGVEIRDSSDTLDMTDKSGSLQIEYEGATITFEKE